MTACLHWTPNREAQVKALAKEIGDRVRAHRKRLGLTTEQYGRRFNTGRQGAIEKGRVPNFTLGFVVKLLDITGADVELRIVPKGEVRS